MTTESFGLGSSGPEMARKDVMNRPMNVTEKLHVRKKQLETELEQINNAINALDANPEVAEVVNTLTKIGGMY